MSDAEKIHAILKGTGPSHPWPKQRMNLTNIVIGVAAIATAIMATIAVVYAGECLDGSPGAKCRAEQGIPEPAIVPTTGCYSDRCAKATEDEALTWIQNYAGAIDWKIVDRCQKRYVDSPTGVHSRSVANCLCVEDHLAKVRVVLGGKKWSAN